MHLSGLRIWKVGEMNDFSHFDTNGNAVMVDVSDKENTKREAAAQGRIFVGKEVYQKIKTKQVEKGDVLSCLLYTSPSPRDCS